VKQFKHSPSMSFIKYAIFMHMPQCVVSKVYDKQLSNGYKRTDLTIIKGYSRVSYEKERYGISSVMMKISCKLLHRCQF